MEVATSNDERNVHHETSGSAGFEKLCITPCRKMLGLRVYGVKDVAADKFIKVCAMHLKKAGTVQYPSWADYVKTSRAKELAPYDEDWFYVRAASMIRHLYIRPECGVGGFRKFYGCKKRRGCRPNRSVKASGKIIRYILQQFEKNGYLQKSGGPSGLRKLTKQGRREVDVISKQCT